MAGPASTPTSSTSYAKVARAHAQDCLRLNGRQCVAGVSASGREPWAGKPPSQSAENGRFRGGSGHGRVFRVGVDHRVRSPGDSLLQAVPTASLMSCRPVRRGGERGFTLLEMVVVMVIIAAAMLLGAM